MSWLCVSKKTFIAKSVKREDVRRTLIALDKTERKISVDRFGRTGITSACFSHKRKFIATLAGILVFTSCRSSVFSLAASRNDLAPVERSEQGKVGSKCCRSDFGDRLFAGARSAIIAEPFASD
jgi:hypothetical protein